MAYSKYYSDDEMEAYLANRRQQSFADHNASSSTLLRHTRAQVFGVSKDLAQSNYIGQSRQTQENLTNNLGGWQRSLLEEREWARRPENLFNTAKELFKTDNSVSQSQQQLINSGINNTPPVTVSQTRVTGHKAATEHVWPQIKKVECCFCKNNNEMPFIYKSHQLKDDRGNITCPILKKYKCENCKHEPDERRSHTHKHCPNARNGVANGTSAPSILRFW